MFKENETKSSCKDSSELQYVTVEVFEEKLSEIDARLNSKQDLIDLTTKSGKARQNKKN